MGSAKDQQDATQRAAQREDAVFGSIALERGLLSKAELESCVKEIEQRSSQGEHVRLGKYLERKQLISTVQFLEVLNEQNRTILTCPSCAAQFNIREQPSGKKMRCKHCKAVLVVPTAIDTQAMADSIASGASRGNTRDALAATYVAEPTGTRFGKYAITGEIARGGMGIVFHARQFGVGREVALKVLKREQVGDPAAIQRFLREAQLAGRLSHPNIVPVYEVGEHEGEPFFAMALVKGKSLEQTIRDQALPRTRALEIVEQVARAIQHAHAQGIIHRDLKPGNVLLDEDGRPMLTDFGLAKHLDGRSLTQSGVDIGTPHYMSPEQVLGKSAEVDEKSDTYALGVILYQLVTRKLPFPGKSAIEIYHKILNDTPVPPSKLKRGLPRDVDLVCAQAMARDRANRYPSAQALADDIARLRSGEPVRARPPGRKVDIAALARAHQVPLAVGLAAVVALVAGAIVWRSRTAPPVPIQARPDPPPPAVPGPGSGPGSPAAPVPVPVANDSDVLMYQARAALTRYQYAQLQSLATQLLALDDANFEAHYFRGVAAYAEKQYEVAEKAFDRTLELNPYFADALFARAHSRFNQDRLDEAKDDYSRLIALPAGRIADTQRTTAHVLRGRCYFHAGRTDEAVLDFQKATELEPNNPQPYHQLGIVCFARERNFSQALVWFDKTLALNKDYIPAMLFRGATQAYLSNFEKAFEDFSNAYDLNPQWVHEFIEMGLEAKDHDPKRYDFDPVEARNFLEEFTKRVGMMAMSGQLAGWKVHLYMGLFHHYTRKYAEAVASVTKAIELAPIEHRRKLYIFRGQANDMLGEHQKAVFDFSSALETEPDDVYGRLYRATSLLKLRDLEQANEDLAVVLRVRPDELRGHLDSGMIAALQHRHADAMAHFEKARAVSLTDSRSYSLRAWLLATSPHPDLEEALREAHKGIERNPELAESWGIAAIVLAAQGDRSQADRYFKKAIEAKPVHWYFDADFYRQQLEK